MGVYIGGPCRESNEKSVVMPELSEVIHDKASNSGMRWVLGILCQVREGEILNPPMIFKDAEERRRDGWGF